MSKHVTIGRAAFSSLTALVCLSLATPVQSAQLTNGPNGTQPNTLDSESTSGTAGVAPSRDISKQGSTAKSDRAQPGEQTPEVTKPKQ